MANRIRKKVNVRAWEEVEQKNILFAPDDSLVETVIENMEHFSSGRITVEDGTNMDVPLPDIAEVRGVLIRSDQDVNIALNGGTALPMKRPSAGASDAPTYADFFFEGTLTSINIAKPATIPAASAIIRYAVYGDPET